MISETAECTLIQFCGIILKLEDKKKKEIIKKRKTEKRKIKLSSTN